MGQRCAVTEKQEFHGPKDYLDLARSPRATAEELRALASASYGFVREAVASNPNTPPDVLDGLLPATVETYVDAEIVAAIAGNPVTQPPTLARVPDLVLPRLHARDDPKSFGAGVELACRPDTPWEALVELIEDERATTEFRKVIARETTCDDLRIRLLSDRSDKARRAAERQR